MFNEKELSMLNQSNGFTLWHYRTGDPVDLVKQKGYFTGDMLSHGDAIYVTCMEGIYHLSVTKLPSGTFTAGGIKR